MLITQQSRPQHSACEVIQRSWPKVALQRGDRALIADPDGGYLASFYDKTRGDVILNPFDARSRKWSVITDIGSIQDADLLARSLIPNTGSSGSGAREWSGYARTFVSAVLRKCLDSGETDSAELWRLIAVATSDELRELLQGTAAQPLLEADNARMFGSIRAVASNAIAALEYVNAQDGHAAFSVRQWVRSGRGVLFLPYQAEQIAAQRTRIATWVRLAIFQTMSLGEGDHRIWIAVDELDALRQIDGLKDALARLRKFGGRCVLGFQSIAQVSSTYGDGPARTIVENCSNTLILRCSASEGGGTARFASQLIGQREVIRPTVTHSTGIEGKLLQREVDRGVSYGEEHRTEDAVMASEIEALPDRAGYLKFASRPAWTLVRFEYFEIGKRAARPSLVDKHHGLGDQEACPTCSSRQTTRVLEPLSANVRVNVQSCKASNGMSTPPAQEQRDIAFYSAAVTAWFATALELDKSILTLAAGAIGLHVTLLTTVGVRSAEGLVLHVAALICFTVSLVLILLILKRNQDHVEAIIRGDISGRDPSLGRLDTIARTAFAIGVILTAIVAIGAALSSFFEREKSMVTKPSDQSQPQPLRESFSGADRLRPPSTERVERSFNGAAGLQTGNSQQNGSGSTSGVQSSGGGAPPASQTQQTQAPPPPGK